MMHRLDELNGTITIGVDEYDELVADSTFLMYLTQAGVDNWEGYGEAQDMMEASDATQG